MACTASGEGFWRGSRRGQLHVYCSVTEDGLHGEWRQLVEEKKQPGGLDMELAARENSMLQEFKDAVTEGLPHTVKLIKVFGSRARGDAKEWSDLDVLIVVKGDSTSIGERIREIRYETMWQHNFHPLISLLLLSEEEYTNLSRLQTGLWRNIEREGVTLWRAL
jgi:predicted nucleotidyltransferase